MDMDAAWRPSVGNRTTSPFKPCNIPLMNIPGLNKAEYVFPDSCHCFHIGWGKDLAASSIVLLAKKKFWPGRSLDARMECGFRDYMGYITQRHKTTGCDGFSRAHFKMSSQRFSISLICQVCSGLGNCVYPQP